MLDNQNIFVRDFAFLVNLLSLDHGQIVQDDLAKVVGVLIFEQLDVAVHQGQQVVEVQIE